jgi:hypothetical protein
LITVLLAGASIATSACGPSEHVDFFQSFSADPAFPGTPDDPAAHQDLFAYTPSSTCNPTVARVLDRKTELRIFRGNGITMDDVRHFLGGLKRYYDHYGVDMLTRYDVLEVPLDHAIVLNEVAIERSMRDTAGVDPSCLAFASPTAACMQAYGAALFFNVKAFLHAYAEPAQNLINVVLLNRVASLDPSPDAAEINWGIAGLGLSESLLTSTGGSDLGASLTQVLDETDFSPTIFLAVNLTDFVLPEPDVVIAHEMGHAYGLVHVDASVEHDNLMNPVAQGCSMSLDLAQLSTIEKVTASFGNVLDPSRYDPLQFLSFTDRAQEILNIMKDRIAGHAGSTKGAP